MTPRSFFSRPHPRPHPGPLPAALAIGAVAQALFAWRLDVPRVPVFDEVHYVPAARTLISLSGSANVEHPLLGKAIIALGIMVFGDTPLGWRAFSTVAATAVVLGAFAILWSAFRSVRTASIGALLVMLNFTVFVQARIAMLDGFMAAFVVLAVAAMLSGARAQGRGAAARWLAGSVLLGLACGTKWTATPYVAFAAVAFPVVRWAYPAAWGGMRVIAAWAMLGMGAGAAYVATFAPALFYAHDPLTPGGLVAYHRQMYALQTQV
ncbi:MAG TPA: phospholipid carrier-dependent glycosyltransferase, partial [Sphingomonas sp.]|nr:phospholipid carrier-dependent glycosyltransferase [Sphingomonas sp.]